MYTLGDDAYWKAVWGDLKRMFGPPRPAPARPLSELSTAQLDYLVQREADEEGCGPVFAALAYG